MLVVGVKQSGFGRDGGAEALDDWTTVKAVKIAIPKL
jgi:aldehyde dehydrogenase (NAD+)